MREKIQMDENDKIFRVETHVPYNVVNTFLRFLIAKTTQKASYIQKTIHKSFKHFFGYFM